MPQTDVFRALEATAAALFHDLADGDEPRVAMLLPAIPAGYFTLWGTVAAGVVCPINHVLDAEHIAELIRAARANILVALGPHPSLDIWSRVPELAGRCPGLKHVLAVGGAPGYRDYDQALAGQPSHDGWRRASDAQRLAALFHTGGTPGAPNLAQHTHGNQLHSAWGAAQMYAMEPGDRIINGLPLAVAQRHIPERPAFPKRIEVLRSMPTTAVGKIYKPAWRARA